jgi:hypothetical protein
VPCCGRVHHDHHRHERTRARAVDFFRVRSPPRLASRSLRANVYAERFLLIARTEASDCTLISSERRAGLGVRTWKPHGSCGSVHGVRKDRKSSFLHGVCQIAAARRGQPWQKEQANKCLESL